MRHDAALVQLTQPIPAATADPFVVQRAAGGLSGVSVVSYARGRADALSRQAACGVLWRQQGLFAFDCDVTFGSSGAPVFDGSGGRPRIVSLISSVNHSATGTVAIGMELPGLVTDMKAALRSGKGVFPEREVRAKRLRVGQSGGSGARFVRP
jgi:protease YdgD